MLSSEFVRLMAYHNAKVIEHTHMPSKVGRRYAKGKAKHVGIVLSNSHVHSQVPIEKIFPQMRIEPKTK